MKIIPALAIVPALVSATTVTASAEPPPTYIYYAPAKNL
jgi:hypothetical protein